LGTTWYHPNYPSSPGILFYFPKKLKIKVLALAPEDFGNFGNAAASMSAEYTPSWCVG
jgi:hypothetical protein